MKRILSIGLGLLLLTSTLVYAKTSPQLRDTLVATPSDKQKFELPWVTIEGVTLPYMEGSPPERYYRQLLFLDVENNIRYKPRVRVSYKGKPYLLQEDIWNSWKPFMKDKVVYNDKYTYCNIFVSDITRLMGVEVPHWVDGRELNANSTYKWLENSEDWAELTYSQAIEKAREGVPVVVSYYNTSNRSGHLAMVSPLSKGKDMYVVQAGSKNSNHLLWAEGRLNPTKYFYNVRRFSWE